MNDTGHFERTSAAGRAALKVPWTLAQTLERRLRARLRRVSRGPESAGGQANSTEPSWLVGHSARSGFSPPGSSAQRPVAHVDQLLTSLEQASALPGVLLLQGAGQCFRAVAALGERSARHEIEAWDLVGRTALLAAAGWARLGRLDEARCLLSQAWQAATRGSPSRALRSSILRRRARLLAAQGDLARAQRLLLRLADLHRRQGEQWAYFLALTSLAEVFSQFSKPDQALAAGALAIRQLDPKRSRRHFRRATLQLAWYCLEADLLEKAREALSCFQRQVPEAVESVDSRLLEHRALWLVARLAERDGQLEQAESLFREAALAFLELGRVRPYCQVTLDRVLLLFRQGRTREILSIIAPVLTLLRQHHCPAHRVAAVILIRKAVAAGELTEELIRAALSALSSFALSSRA